MTLVIDAGFMATGQEIVGPVAREIHTIVRKIATTASDTTHEMHHYKTFIRYHADVTTVENTTKFITQEIKYQADNGTISNETNPDDKIGFQNLKPKYSPKCNTLHLRRIQNRVMSTQQHLQLSFHTSA